MSQPRSGQDPPGSSTVRNSDLEPLLALGDLGPASVDIDRVEAVLHGLAQVAADVVRGAEAASLTLVGADGALTTRVYTSTMAEHLDAVQYAAQEGPCLEAATAKQWTAILVADLRKEVRWRDFAPRGAAAGARSVLSVSLLAGPRLGAGGVQQAVGSLNFYARAAGVFGDSDRDTALLLALLAAAVSIGDADVREDQLKAAMDAHSVIGQAQGILMERHKFTAGQAFDRLRKVSMNLNRKLRDVARDLSETGDEIALAPRQAQSRVESDRIKALARYDILDTPRDGAFDRVAVIAAKLFGVPMATVSFVDTDRVWFKASLGLAGVRQVTRDPGLCASVILAGEPYVVSNARTDPRTSAHPLVTGELGLQFYAAAPITTSEGYHLGTVAVLGTEPGEATPEQLGILTDLAAIVMDELELRLSAMSVLRGARRALT